MKLGFWNRMALVAGGLGSLAGGTITVVSQNYKTAELRESGYQDCAKQVGKPGSDLSYTACHDMWRNVGHGMGLADWLMMIGAYALVAVALYLLIALFVWLIRWVWAGRQ